jgi:hypothetical protein
MKILLYGSAYMSAIVEASLMEAGHTIVGHIPCAAPSFPGVMRSPIGPAAHDIRLSAFYDRRIYELEDAWNIHPGLLPRWGGCDILYHTIVEGQRLQGLTFHGLEEGFDTGPILSTVTYPVSPDDEVIDLYRKVMALIGPFAVAGVALIEAGATPVPQTGESTYYPRSDVFYDIGLYRRGGDAIRRLIQQ